ncbi:hypothetical protein EGW08_007960, partial [Elysia chlorotica]
DITANLVRLARTPNLTGRSNRQKRQAETNDEQDLIIGTTIAPEANMTSFNQASATNYCRQFMESTPTLSACAEYLDPQAVEGSVLSCAEDLVEMGDTEWATSHLEDLTEQCVDSAQREEAAWNSTDEARDGEPA